MTVKLPKFREKFGFSVNDVARITGYSSISIHRLENGLPVSPQTQMAVESAIDRCLSPRRACVPVGLEAWHNDLFLSVQRGDLTQLSKLVVTFRLARKITRPKLAEMAQCSESVIFNIEKGRHAYRLHELAGVSEELCLKVETTIKKYREAKGHGNSVEEALAEHAATGRRIGLMTQPSNKPKNFTASVRAFRHKYYLSLQQLADLAGCSVSVISAIERGFHARRPHAWEGVSQAMCLQVLRAIQEHNACLIKSNSAMPS